jgi:mannose-6-phosphate isomerase class I
MQNGSITRSTRSHGPDVWEFRWREAGADGKRKHRRMVIGSIAQFSEKSSALLEVAALRREINLNDPRLSLQPVTVSELVNHYRQRELATDHTWKTHSTKAQALTNGTVADDLVWFNPKPGDGVFVPAGTVHALGGDVVAFENQP